MVIFQDEIVVYQSKNNNEVDADYTDTLHLDYLYKTACAYPPIIKQQSF